MFILMQVPCMFIVFITTNQCTIIYHNNIIITVSLHIKYTPTCFDINMSVSGSFTFVPCQVTYILKISAVTITIP